MSQETQQPSAEALAAARRIHDRMPKDDPKVLATAREIDAEFAALRARLERAEEDSKRLDWLCEYVTDKGLNGLEKLVWSFYDDEGKSLMHRMTLSEEEVGDMKFDRPAIDAAIDAPSAKPGEGEK